MSDLIVSTPQAARRPALPRPTRQRWQPLRIGLVELFHYDSEEFWFHDGHLLLRGNNGTGKSKVLSLSLPFLLDANLRSSRVEPDGDSTKRMAWNLLTHTYNRRMGYTWIEFGRRCEDGTEQYLTLGAGLFAVEGRPQVESWFFLIEDDGNASGCRIGQDIWLTTQQQTVLTKERLRESLEGRGQLFENASAYRRAVDERLFHLGARRYDALIDTLIQLRQPQLSKKPDERSLSNALTEALPPLPADLLGDVADALNQLEEDRRQLEAIKALEQAVTRFDQRYRTYASTQSRRQVRVLRRAQTDFDTASRLRTEALQTHQQALDEETRLKALRDAAELALQGAREHHDTLRSDPANQDANRLESAERDAEARRSDLRQAGQTRDETRRRLDAATAAVDEAERALRTAAKGLERARGEIDHHAADAGVASAIAQNRLRLDEIGMLASMTPHDVESAKAQLLEARVKRLDHVKRVRQCLEALTHAQAAFESRHSAFAQKQEDCDTAAAMREQADADVENEAQTLVEAWSAYFDTLRHLNPVTEMPMALLEAWVRRPDADNPARSALQVAEREAALSFASREAELTAARQKNEADRDALLTEKSALEAGEDAVPPLPYTRAADVRSGRVGAPFWQLIDFVDGVDAASRAGLEAALEAAGILDAWVTPDGAVETLEGMPLHDTQLLQIECRPNALDKWLQPAASEESGVPHAIVQSILGGIACSARDDGDAHAWVGIDGQFRVGPLTGAWSKPQATYIGLAARRAAREQRLQQIAGQLNSLADEWQTLSDQLRALAQVRLEIGEDMARIPTEQGLYRAHAAAAQHAQQFQRESERLRRAQIQLHEAQEAFQAARVRLRDDANDLRLPEEPEALAAVEMALIRFQDASHDLAHAIQTLRQAADGHGRENRLLERAQTDFAASDGEHARRETEALRAERHFETLRESIGAKVDQLRQRITEARIAEQGAEARSKECMEALQVAMEQRAVTARDASTAASTLETRQADRETAIRRLQEFAASGLLQAALPSMEIPLLTSIWTIEPALTVARRAEQLLVDVRDDDESWHRVQRQINEDVTNLQSSLSALSHQAQAATTDWGLVVHIVYQNRSERPDALVLRLADEIAQRSELLTAKERSVLENHLEAEIAAEIQRLLQAGEQQLNAINAELDKRPTSTGVKFRLLWLPLTEKDGAPVGLELARKRLLNTGSDLWSSEDRRVVGAMLQERIRAERENAEAEGGSLIDQLARALDYRRWHEFRVQRWQDGQWRKLSGPASSGERALGVTVPLFAAVASFYSQSAYAFAPRLILLDEAFAGIDDSARAHCMALVREFDLDFVITSEREWACYAELPGVAICQLARHPGIDAVHVSRWTWDGRAKQRAADPDRRFGGVA